MNVNYNNKDVNVEIIGGFKIEDLNKEYVLCSFDDNKDSDKEAVVICEIERENDIVTLRDIPQEETDMVLLFYKTVKSDLLGSDNNE